MSGSRNDSVTIKITLEIVSKGASLTAMEPQSTIEQAEDRYCKSRARETSERLARRKWDRLRRRILSLGWCSAGLVLAVIICTLGISIVTNPLTAIAASAILTLSLRAILKLVQHVAG